MGPGAPAKEYFESMDDDEIRALVTRLARPHPAGGKVIERVAILAEGADFNAVMRWITAHDGVPETAVATVAKRGLHSSRISESAAEANRAPRRFVLPPGALV